jgi:ABC-type dipeptide/oligopeptide/nickel transport system ATPase component
MQPSQPRLKIRDLKTHFFTRAGVAKAANGVSFDIMPQMHWPW